MVGRTISHYRVLEKLGEGGMGVVYKARDTHLDRFVAIKVLPPERVADPERKRRFVQEAKAASALNHPNIITIYDIDEAGGVHFMAMEYVAGKTLAQLIGRKGLAVSEGLKCAVQIADALAKAHAAGIIHRDLKPSNLMVTGDGLVKVLDFGLAKLTEPVVPEEAPTRTLKAEETPHTEEGTVLGTVAYMSPEQAEGKPVDARSDIFSFGAVLYEMVSGQRAFQGDSKLSTLAAVIRQDPAPLPAGVPRDLARIISRCLRKDLDRRFQNMSDLRIALLELKEESDSGRLRAETPARSRRWVAWWALASALIVLIAAGGALWWLSVRRSAPASPPLLTRLTSDSGLTTDPALSPDGRLLAYASDRGGDGNLDIYVRQVGGGDPLRLTQDPADDCEPSFSPDGTQVVFRSGRGEGGIYVVSALGGPARRIASGGSRPQFSPDGNWIAYSVGRGDLSERGQCKIYLVASGGGTPRQVQASFFAAEYPTWAPDGKHLLFLGRRDGKGSLEDEVDWWITSLDSETAVRTGALAAIRKANLSGRIHVFPGVLLTPAWHPAGDSLIFSARSGDSTNLWRMGISPKTWEVTRPPQRVTSGPTLEENPSVGSGPGGAVRVAFASLSENIDLWSLPIDANQGKVTGDLKRLTENAAADVHPGLSKDGAKMAFISDRSGRQEIWIKDLRSGEESALTASRSDKWLPRFSPDGSTVSFSSYENKKWNIYLVPATGGGAEMICEDCGEATGWSSDGKRIIGNALPWRVWLVDLESRRSTDLRLRLVSGSFSPDARWITLTDNQKSFVAPFRGEASFEESALFTVAEGAMVQWSPDGAWLYGTSRRDGNVCLWAQRLDPATKHAAEPPQPIFHSHSRRRSIVAQDPTTMCMVRDRIVFSIVERSGNIWMAEYR